MKRRVRCYTIWVDGHPVRVRGTRQPTEVDMAAIREMRDALVREARRPNPNQWAWDGDGCEVAT